jgi:hypothetical protein
MASKNLWIATDLHVADEPHAWRIERLVEGVAHRANAEVVRRDAVPDESEGDGQLVDDIDLDGSRGGESIGRVHARGA